MNTTSTAIRTETLADVVARQSVVADWLRNMVAEHGPEAEVITQTRVTAFGNFLTSVEVTA